MTSFKCTIKNQDGSTLIIVMLVLMAVTVMGITAMNISTTEVQLAGNDKWQKMGLYNGDPGLHGTPALIYPIINDETYAPLPPADPNDPNDKGCLEYINNLAPLDFKEIVLAEATDPEPNLYQYKDISFRACKINADIDICPRGAEEATGGGVEFAAGSEGIGVSGGRYKKWRITSTGDGGGNSTFTVRGHYVWYQTGGGLR